VEAPADAFGAFCSCADTAPGHTTAASNAAPAAMADPRRRRNVTQRSQCTGDSIIFTPILYDAFNNSPMA
jgi:hypothetical protein